MGENRENKRDWIMITCSNPNCRQEFGSYLHFCPSCGLKNDSELHEKYWERKLLETKS